MTTSSGPETLGFSWESFRSFLGDVYYETINYDNMAVADRTNCTINVVDGQTAFYRTEILGERDFFESFLAETLFGGKFGPFQGGDDAFITRWLVKRNWKIVYQSTGEDCIQIPLKDNTHSLRHLERRLRNNYRSHLKSIGIFRMWQNPYGILAVVMAGLVNFSL
jgi:hypothetical protein